MELEFWKLSGAGNDFIVMNNMDGHFPEEGRRELFQKWCQRGMSVGADGVLLLEPSQRAHFRMRYYNADGGEAETCGNGSRCIARLPTCRA
jgi:diaminopimelate epimerase